MNNPIKIAAHPSLTSVARSRWADPAQLSALHHWAPSWQGWSPALDARSRRGRGRAHRPGRAPHPLAEPGRAHRTPVGRRGLMAYALHGNDRLVMWQISPLAAAMPCWSCPSPSPLASAITDRERSSDGIIAWTLPSFTRSRHPAAAAVHPAGPRQPDAHWWDSSPCRDGDWPSCWQGPWRQPLSTLPSGSAAGRDRRNHRHRHRASGRARSSAQRCWGQITACGALRNSPEHRWADRPPPVQPV